jgi:hypothetical protein
MTPRWWSLASLGWLPVVSAALALPVCADEAGSLSLDEARAWNVETTVEAWLPAASAAVSSSSWTLDLAAVRGAGSSQDVLAVLATLRQFDDEQGERRERVLRVHVVNGGTASLVREYRLGDPETYVRLLGVGDLDGNDGAEVALSYASGGSTGGIAVEIVSPFGEAVRPGCTTHSDEAATILDVNGDGVLELLVTRLVIGHTSPRCNAERVYVEEVLEYRCGSLRRVEGSAAPFYRERLARVEATLETARTNATTSSYFLEAQQSRAAVLRARAESR